MPKTKTPKVETIKTAWIDTTQKYRYNLTRSWDASLGTVNFIGINPSTADAQKDDNTIRVCINYAKSWGYGSLVMTNLFAYRSTDPDELLYVRTLLDERAGPDNNTALLRAAASASLIVAVWGNHRAGFNQRNHIMKLLQCYDLHCLIETKDGCPGHPLRKSAALTPQPYRVRSIAKPPLIFQHGGADTFHDAGGTLVALGKLPPGYEHHDTNGATKTFKIAGLDVATNKF